MEQSKKLSAGILRNDRQMADGRTIRYYDTSGQNRSAKDARPVEQQPAIGELRLDPLLTSGLPWLHTAKVESFYLPKNSVHFVQQQVSS